eukprot:6248921-Lingulodinium_polyedra.AAC.1
MPPEVLGTVLRITRALSQRIGAIAFVPATPLWQALPPFRFRGKYGTVNAWRHGFDYSKDPKGLGRLAGVWH